jgi:DNA-directed RNA polymerase specialized sigma24 family protein
MNVDDAALVRRLADSRDEDAFRELYARHAPGIYGFVRRLTGRSGDPSAVMHETWIRALRDLHLFRGQCTFPAWIAGISLSSYREWQHRHARNESLDALFNQHRGVVDLYDMDNGSLDEIARVSVRPPAGLEDELVTALRIRGLLRPRRVTAWIAMAGRVADRLTFRRRNGGNSG